jgi:hypothetical protein
VLGRSRSIRAFNTPSSKVQCLTLSDDSGDGYKSFSFGYLVKGAGGWM